MVAIALTAPLQRVALFQDLTPMQIGEIARTAERVMFKPGQTIVTCDAEADAAFLIVSGEARRVEGPELGGLPEIVEAGSLVGEMAMIVETEHSSTIVAMTPVRALKITRASLLAHMTNDPTLADRLVDRIAERLNRLAGELRAIDTHLAGITIDQLALAAPDTSPVLDSVGATLH
jgi:CRP-like cAMP-binding protein